ncbi:MAG: YjfB family protein [Lachnospiraceae bacterium]|nr:YjfB family protein [Lachnospiraceae bacterium]
MDVAAVSMALANIELGTKVGTAMLDKAMNTNEELASGLIQMIDSAAMERSVNPNVGGNLDIRI